MHNEKGVIRVLVADDHRLVRVGIRDYLSMYSSSVRCMVDEAGTAEEAIDKAARTEYDVVLMDYKIPEGGGPRATEQILERHPGIRVLALSIYEGKPYVKSMKRAGARGFLSKDVEPDILMQAIRKVMSGGRYYSNDIAVQWMEGELAPDGSGPEDRLTDREREVLGLILRGYKSSEIGQQLFLSSSTVNKHREHIREKLGVHSVVELVQAGMALGICG